MDFMEIVKYVEENKKEYFKELRERNMGKQRYFEIVKDEHRQNFTKVMVQGKEQTIYHDIVKPNRADPRSAGYDFYMPSDLQLLPAQKTIIWTDVKAFMQDDEVLSVYPRSSTGIKQGLMLANTVGKIDASYYENPGNDGNIGIALLNTSGKAINFKAGDRVVQGIFSKFLTVDDDVVISEVRAGGIGSSGK